ncbi:hypothetical protein DFJ73DRAFT_813462 [Zopfochytrium polystomum]|nr:hypothetical protein DFJ73DRAFT_813462 [Zopfochytrium polystomum]
MAQPNSKYDEDGDAYDHDDYYDDNDDDDDIQGQPVGGARHLLPTYTRRQRRLKEIAAAKQATPARRPAVGYRPRRLQSRASDPGTVNHRIAIFTTSTASTSNERRFRMCVHSPLVATLCFICDPSPSHTAQASASHSSTVWSAAPTTRHAVYPPSSTALDCPHKARCHLTGTKACCACEDRRPFAATYWAYADGLGMVASAARNAYYCPGCRSAPSRKSSKMKKPAVGFAEGMKKEDQEESGKEKVVETVDGAVAVVEQSGEKKAEKVDGAVAVAFEPLPPPPAVPETLPPPPTRLVHEETLAVGIEKITLGGSGQASDAAAAGLENDHIVDADDDDDVGSLGGADSATVVTTASSEWTRITGGSVHGAPDGSASSMSGWVELDEAGRVADGGDNPARVKICGHRCLMRIRNECCACGDLRPVAERYWVFVVRDESDAPGTVGSEGEVLETQDRSALYCAECKTGNY